MVKTYIAIFFTLFLTDADIVLGQTSKSHNIIPEPAVYIKEKGRFTLRQSTKIQYANGLISEAIQLQEILLKELKYDLEILPLNGQTGDIAIILEKESENQSHEEYALKVSNTGIFIKAPSELGIFWALQTIRQLLSKNNLDNSDGNEWYVSNCTIKDWPRFAWRGLMIDYSRTFWDVEVTKKYLDAMAFYKMNVLQMHLTDDQGWRIEIEKYPELTQIASRFDPMHNEPEERQGYYTKEELREIVAYAAERNITIVPEIEMPGHTSEVFSVFPELSCRGDTLPIHTQKYHAENDGGGIRKDILCAGNDDVFDFLEDVLSETLDIFPSQYIHIGGDEAPKERWKNCHKCQKRIKDLGLENEDELQRWFIQNIERFLMSKGRILVGWDEIVEGGLNNTAVIMYWRPYKKEIPKMVLENGNSLVNSNRNYGYFDYTYNITPSKKVYKFNPIPEDVDSENLDNLLGIQAAFWSHIHRTETAMDRQIFPRLLPYAEVAWSHSNKNWHEFEKRMRYHFQHLDKMGIHYTKER